MFTWAELIGLLQSRGLSKLSYWILGCRDRKVRPPLTYFYSEGFFTGQMHKWTFCRWTHVIYSVFICLSIYLISMCTCAKKNPQQTMLEVICIFFSSRPDKSNQPICSITFVWFKLHTTSHFFDKCEDVLLTWNLGSFNSVSHQTSPLGFCPSS